MTEWWFIGLLGFILSTASVVLVYPLRRCRFGMLLGLPLVLVIGGIGYSYWGSFGPFRTHLQAMRTQELAQAMLKTIKSPQELIDKIQTKLKHDPDSAKGWFLLGRLYTSQKEWDKASEAFAKAHHLEPKDEQFAVHYAHNLWKKNNQQFNFKIRTLFLSLLQDNPNQPDALAMLAMDAYETKQYKQAINYWERLLRLAPGQSEEAAAIRKAIAKAEEQVKNLND